MVHKDFCISCDTCHMFCDLSHANTMTGARIAAKNAGWVHHKGKDYCPEHAPPGTISKVAPREGEWISIDKIREGTSTPSA